MEEKQTEAAKLDVQVFYEACKASPIGIAVEDLEGRPLFVNPALCSMLGFSEDELRSKHCVELSPPEDAEKDWALFQELRAGSIDHYHIEKRFLRRDGSLIWGRLSLALIKNQASPLVVAMVESEEPFRLAANAAPVMIWMSGVDKLCIYVNRGWLDFTGRSLQEEMGSAWTEGVHPDDLEECLATYVRAFDRREPVQMQYRLRRHDGEHRWILDTGVPRYNADGSFAGYIGSAIDVTERKLAEDSLSTMSQRLIEAQEEERSRVARELHDDINQRLAMVAVHLDGMQQGLPASAAEFRQAIGEACKQIAQLGKDIQAMSRRLHSSQLELLGIEKTAAAFCKELSDRQHVEITFASETIPDELPKDITLGLFRVLQEAVQNAIKHSGSRHIQVLLRGESNEIQMTVHDSGIGFEPKEAITGRGLGLTSMRERMKLVNGQLSIDSKPEVGTTIHARVPLGPQKEVRSESRRSLPVD